MLRPILAALGASLVAAFLATPVAAHGNRQAQVQVPRHHHHHRHHHHGSLLFGTGFYGPYDGYCGAACTGLIYAPALAEGETCTRYYLRDRWSLRPLGFACRRVDGLWDMFPDPLPPSDAGGFGSIAPIE